MNMRAFPILVSILSLLPAVSFAEEAAPRTVVVEGRLLEKGTKRPVPYANVFLLPSKAKAITEADGRFRFESVVEGEASFVVNLTGYERLDSPDYISVTAPAYERVLYLPKLSYQIYETTIYGKADKRDDSTRSLKASVATKLPGSNNDPIKAVQNLPGVSRTSGFSSQVIIQGSAPEDTRYTVDGHNVPIIFHFGGFSSVVLPEALDRIDYLSAGYGVEYGRAMGGQIGVWTRKPDRERVKGFAYADLINAGAAIEAPVGEKGSLIAGIRRSYIGNVLKAVSNSEDDDAALTAAPGFGDFTVIYDQPLSAKDEFRLDALASQDTFSLLINDSPANEPRLRGDFDLKTSFVRLIPQWTHQHSERTKSRWSLGIGRDWIKVLLGDQYFKLNLRTITVRGEVERAWSEAWTSYFGMDHELGWAKVDVNFPDTFAQGGVANPASTGEQQKVGIRSESMNLGFYWNNDVKVSQRWTLKPGLRFDRFGTVGESHVSPRFAVRRALGDWSALRFATGLYYQPPRPQETAEQVGNPDLVSPRATHYALSFERDFRERSSRGIFFQNGVFYRDFDRLVVPTSNLVTRNGAISPEFYNNGGEGRAFGYEMLGRYEASPWTGWLSYTLSRSTRKQPGQPWYPATYDQTHNVNIIIARDLPKNWRLSSRFRFVTGNPFTPVTGGIFDADNDSFVPVRGPFYSERLGSFYQLDIRADKTWALERVILTAYLDIQNATNRKNVERVQYAYDYSRREDVTGLPIIPSIGLKGEF